MAKFSKTIAIVAIYIAAISPVIAQQATTPQSKVEAFHATLLGVMKQAKTLSAIKSYKCPPDSFYPTNAPILHPLGPEKMIQPARQHRLFAIPESPLQKRQLRHGLSSVAVW